MLNLVWSPVAQEDFQTIIAFIAERNPSAANRLKIAITACAERLTEHPYLYRRGRIAGTREAVIHPNYVVIYRVGIGHVEIVNVIHSRRQYPPSED